MQWRKENWRKRGKVEVLRNKKGHIKSWRKEGTHKPPKQRERDKNLYYHIFKCEVSEFIIHHTMILEGVNRPDGARDFHDKNYPDHVIKEQYYAGYI